MTTPTTVTSVTTSSGNGVEHVGDTVTFTISFDSAITVSGGTPTLTLNDGGIAAYDAAATAALGDPTKLVFTYTVATSDQSVTGLSFVRGDQNGAVIFDTSTGQGPDFTNLFAANFPDIQVATSPTAVTSVVTSPANGVEHAGDIVTFTIAFNRAVTISGGTPTLTLNDGGIATYDAAATAALGDATKAVFTYTVAADDQSVAGLSFVRGDQNGAVIVDALGQGPDFANLFAASFPGLWVSTTAVTSEVASPANVVEQTGDTVAFTIAFNHAVAVWGGTPTLTLSNGGIARYDAAATAALGDTTKLVFTYTVAASDQSVVGLSLLRGDLNGAAITDASGQQPDFTNLLATGFPDIQVAPQGRGLGGAEIAVSAPSQASLEHEQVTRLANGGFVVTWENGAQVFAQDGAEVGAAALAGKTLDSASITALSDGGFVVTWQEYNSQTHNTTIKAQVFAADGTATSTEMMVNTSTYGPFNPKITALSNGGFVVTWTGSGDFGTIGAAGDSSGAAVRAQLYAADGTRTGSEILVNTTTTSDQEAAVVTALPNGGFVVTWTDYSGSVATAGGSITQPAVRAQVFDGSKIGQEILVSTPIAHGAFQPSIIVLANGDFAIGWNDSHYVGNYTYVPYQSVQIFAADGNKIGSPITLPDSGVNRYEMTALSNGGFVVTWDTNYIFNSSGPAVVGQVFAAGTKIGAAIPINTAFSNGGFANSQITALSDGGFVVTWQDWSHGVGGASGDFNGTAIKAQMFGGDGTKVGSEILVNINTPNYQRDPQITALEGGRFAVTWTDYTPGWAVGSKPNGSPESAQVRVRVFDPSPDTTVIAAGTTLEISTATAARLAFAPEGAALLLDHSTAFIGQINGFGGADTIDLGDIAFGSGTTVGYAANSSNSGGTLTISDGTHTSALALLGQYAAASFALGSDGHGGTIIASASATAQANMLAAPHA